MRCAITSIAPPPPPYERVGVRLWRHGSAVWSPLVWLENDKFEPQFIVAAQAQLLLLAFARRVNEEGQTCDVLIGTAAFTVPNGRKSTLVDILDHCHHACQVRLCVTVDGDDSKTTSMPDYMLLTQAPPPPHVRRRGTTTTDYEDEFLAAQREDLTERLIVAKPVMCDFDEMIRGEIFGPLGRRLPILDWLQHMTTETGRRTPAMYFTWLANWYLKWRKISLESFQKSPHEYADILPFLCGHHTWTYPYCADDCLNPNPTATSTGRLLRPCDTWASGRWIPSPLRATDCEDNAVDIVATFRALQQIVPDSIKVNVQGGNPSEHAMYERIQNQHRQLAKALLALAKKYTALLADTTLWICDHFALHMYVKLVPTDQLDVLLGAARKATSRIQCPVLTVDSTRRCWAPTKAMNSAESTTLTQLHATLRSLVHAVCTCDKCQVKKIHDNCQCTVCALIQTVGEFFSWGTPCDMWQTLSSGMYHTDLRYYDVANGRVYLPQLPPRANAFVRELPGEALGRNTDTLLFGVPALSIDGFMGQHGQMDEHLVPLGGYKLPTKDKVVTTDVFLTDVTDIYLQQGQFGRRKPAVTTNAFPIIKSAKRPLPTKLVAAAPGEEERKDKEDAPPLPPVPRIEFDFRLPHVSWQEDLVDIPPLEMARLATIPVFVRPIDAAKCTTYLHKDYRHHALKEDRHHMFNVAVLLEVISITARTKNAKHSEPYQRNLRVARMERMYVQEPQQYVYVYYVTASDTSGEQQPLESYLAAVASNKEN
jgi:hypothetical protein